MELPLRSSKRPAAVVPSNNVATIFAPDLTSTSSSARWMRPESSFPARATVKASLPLASTREHGTPRDVEDFGSVGLPP